MEGSIHPISTGGQGSVLDQSVDVMLGAVLGGRDFEDVCYAKESLAGVLVCYDLEQTTAFLICQSKANIQNTNESKESIGVCLMNNFLWPTYLQDGEVL